MEMNVNNNDCKRMDLLPLLLILRNIFELFKKLLKTLFQMEKMQVIIDL